MAKRVARAKKIPDPDPNPADARKTNDQLINELIQHSKVYFDLLHWQNCSYGDPSWERKVQTVDHRWGQIASELKRRGIEILDL